MGYRLEGTMLAVCTCEVICPSGWYGLLRRLGAGDAARAYARGAGLAPHQAERSFLEQRLAALAVDCGTSSARNGCR